jgi:hypothetical protein
MVVNLSFLLTVLCVLQILFVDFFFLLTYYRPVLLIQPHKQNKPKQKGKIRYEYFYLWCPLLLGGGRA